jgi:hypothetical protein
MTVFNIRRRAPQPGDVYIGRAGHGLDGYFGNPIRRGELCPMCDEVHEERGSTLHCFEAWAKQRLREDPVYRERVKNLHGKNLGCFCVPSPCHGSILARLARGLQPPSPDLISELFS